MPHHNPNLRFGPRRYFAPICIRHKTGYYGGLPENATEGSQGAVADNPHGV